MILSCLVVMDEHVNYTWYRGSELLQVGRNLTYVEQRSDTDGMNTYTCNVSNRASWASHTLNITQGCSSAHQGTWSTLWAITGAKGVGSHNWTLVQEKLVYEIPGFYSQCLIAFPLGILASVTIQPGLS